MVETYKKIDGIENYSVSDHGNVRNEKTGKNLKGSYNDQGYLRVCLNNNKIKHHKYIHKLVAEAFLLNPENKKCVDHIDNDKQNNNIINLRFATHSQNNQNRSISIKNKSGTKGVNWNKNTNKWTAQIFINGKVIN